jgi:Family of unknown function (DUF6134)
MRRLRPSLALGPRRRRPPPAPRCCRRPSPRSRHETRGEVGRHVIPCAGGDRLIGETPIEGEARVLMIPICQRAARDREVGQGDRRLAFDRRGVDNGGVYDQAQKVPTLALGPARPGWRAAGAPREGEIFAGPVYEVSVRAAGKRSVIDGRRGRIAAPATIVSNHAWNRAVVDRRLLLDARRGGLQPVPASAAGATTSPVAGGAVRARKYVVTGDLERALWYGADGAWRQSRLDYQGDVITRARRVRRGNLRQRVQRPPVASSGR